MTDFDLNAELTIARLGQRGEGLARHDGGMIAVPYARPGEIVRAELDRDRAKLIDVPSAVVEKTFMAYQPKTRRPFGVMDWAALLRKLDRIDPSYRD